jgi:hypothetical protein
MSLCTFFVRDGRHPFECSSPLFHRLFSLTYVFDWSGWRGSPVSLLDHTSRHRNMSTCLQGNKIPVSELIQTQHTYSHRCSRVVLITRPGSNRLDCISRIEPCQLDRPARTVRIHSSQLHTSTRSAPLDPSQLRRPDGDSIISRLRVAIVFVQVHENGRRRSANCALFSVLCESSPGHLWGLWGNNTHWRPELVCVTISTPRVTC